MSLLDELTGALSAAEGMLAALGPRPKGDVAGMRQLVSLLRTEASTIATEASAAGRLPGAIGFAGPGRADLEGNASMVSGVALGAARQLEAAAERVSHEASKIEHAQHEWDRNRHNLQTKISGLAGQMRSAGK